MDFGATAMTVVASEDPIHADSLACRPEALLFVLVGPPAARSDRQTGRLELVVQAVVGCQLALDGPETIILLDFTWIDGAWRT